MPVTFGLVMGGIGALGKMGAGIGQLGAAKKIKPNFRQYAESPYAKQNLGAVQNLFYGRTPGMSQAQANIQSAQANQMAAAQRNATDSSTLLALGAASQGATNSAFSNLAAQEAQSKMSLLPALNQAYAMNIAEGDKVQKSIMDKFMIDTQQKQQLGQAGLGNIFGGFQDLAGGAMQFGNFKNAQNYNNILKGSMNPMQNVGMGATMPASLPSMTQDNSILDWTKSRSLTN
jgi:hypothetical protein